MGRLLLVATRNLLQNRRRSLLLGGAIAAVTLLLVLLLGVSHGIQHTMLRAATTLSTGYVNVGGFFKVTSGQAAPVVTHYRKLLDLVRHDVPEARLVVDRLRGWGKVVSATTSIQVGISGIDVTQEAKLPEVVKVVSGDLQGLRRPHTVVLFEKQAKRLDVRVGDELTISAQTVRGANNAVDVEIVAIAQDMGLLSSFSVFTPKQTVRDIYLLGKHATGAIQLLLADESRSDEVAARLRGAISRAGYRVMDPQNDPFWKKFTIVTREDWTGQKIDVTTWKDEMSFLLWVLTAFDAITAVVVGILLVIIVVGLMNVLWMAIRERTREIGTLRAIGMHRRRVLLMFVLEAGVLSLSATLCGALLGTLAALGLDAAAIRLSPGFAVFLMSDTLHLLVTPGSVLQAILVISLTTTLFALYPANQAARLPPVTAIHHVG